MGGYVQCARQRFEMLTPVTIKHCLSVPESVLQWASVIGKTYTVIYSDTLNATNWYVATPSITATANVTQWYDDGPPKTMSPPASATARFYRVIKN